ncbi:MAG: hypothetical protein ACKVS9_03465 [Phycisphaerae bacterium]
MKNPWKGAICGCALATAAATAGEIPVLQSGGSEPLVHSIVAPTDGTWIVMDELMTVNSFYAGIFTYTSATPLQLDLTDLFVVSDRNQVYLDFAFLGVTPAVIDWQALFPAVGPFDDAPYTMNPAVAWTRPEFSKQSFIVPAGTHTLTFRNIHIPLDQFGNPFPDGTAAFRLTPEPSTAAMLGCAAAMLFGMRRRGRSEKPSLTVGSRKEASAVSVHDVPRHSRSGFGFGSGLAVLALVAAIPNVADAAPCGPFNAAVTGSTLQIDLTTGDDEVRVALQLGNPAIVEVFTPASSVTPSCTFSSISTPFSAITVIADMGDDLVVIDDSNGIVSNSFTLSIDGGDGADTVLAGIELDVTPLASALSMISTLQQAQNAVNAALALLDNGNTGCSSAYCLSLNMATVVKNAGNDVVKPTAEYVRDMQPDIVQPAGDAIAKSYDRIRTYLQTFMQQDVLNATAEAETFVANVEIAVDEFELLIPMANDLLGRATTLYERASRLDLNAQNQDAISVFINTINSHTTTIQELGDLCPEDPEPVETDFNEDNQDPSGLSVFCAEVERRIEALEAINDNVETNVDNVEATGDQYEADGDAMEMAGDAVGDDENPTSDAAQIESQGDGLVLTGDNMVLTGEALQADWESWIEAKELLLDTAGANVHARGFADVDGAAITLEAQAQADLEAVADAIRADAEQIVADIVALSLAAAPLIRDDLNLIPFAGGGGGTCPVTPTHTVNGGIGTDLLIGTTGSDLLDGGDGADLLVGAGGADQLRGGDGNDLLFGGGGDDDMNGGADVDVIIGNAGNDCMFGGGGQTLTAGTLTVDVGDIFVGLDGNDTMSDGDDTSDSLSEIDFAFGGAGNDFIRMAHGGTMAVGTFSFQFGNLVLGNAGDDDIGTMDGLDVIFGGTDADTIATEKGAQLTIGSGSSQFRLELGDLIFGGTGTDTIDSDIATVDPNADPNDPRPDDDIDVVFGGDDNDTINGYGGGLLSIGSVSNPDFELLLGNLIFGGDGDDEINTLDGIDVIFGGNDADTITTNKGDQLTIGSGSNQFRLGLGDLIFGRDGDDVIHSDDSVEDPNADPNDPRPDDDIDVVFGGNGADEIHGYGGALLSIGDVNDPDFELELGNVIFGGDQNDTIDTLEGIDVIFGGEGDDTVAAGKGYLLNVNDDFKANIGDLIFGQNGNDTLHGDAEDPADDASEDGIDVIFGGTGDDGIYSGTGGTIEVPDQNFCLLFGNVLFGGPGDDTIRCDYLNWDSNAPLGGIDVVLGRTGNDTIEGAEGSLIIIGDITSGQAIVIGFGNVLFGGADNDNIFGADGTDICTGASDDLDDLISDLGLDDLGGAADLIFCGSGDDTAEAYAGIDLVFGSDGMDNLSGAHGGFFIVPINGVPVPIALGNIMFGGDDDDIIDSLGRLLLPTVPPIEIDLLFGNRCDDTISAGDGLNLVFGNKDDDTITAGDGINILFGNNGEDGVSAGTGLNVCFGNRENDIVTAGDGINVLFGNRGNDTVSGNIGLNVLFGNKGNDIVQAGTGLAILFGNSGVDTVTGGAGLSICFGNRQNDVVSGGNGLCVLFGNPGDDSVTGANGLSVVFGNAGHDIVGAGAGLAVLFGNAGDDRVAAGPGLSVQFGNRDNDIIRAGGGLLVGFGNREDDVLVGAGGLNLAFGNAGSDQFFGGGGVNITFGNREGDIIRGGGSTDFLFGNRDNDQISGAGAKDFIFGNRGDDSLVSDGTGDFVFGNRGNDTVRSGGDGSDKDYLFGNRGNDSMFGCSNADKLFGGRGSDSKDRNDCNGLSLSAPSRGEVRGMVLIDVDGDLIGDMPHAGVTVTCGPNNAVTDADGIYRIAYLPVGSHNLSQAVPSGYSQIAGPATNPINIGAMGIDLYLGEIFVNRENCFVAPDGFSCLGSSCQPAGAAECLPVRVCLVQRCPDTGEVCDEDTDCPCNDCVPSFTIDECACVDPQTGCYIDLSQATGIACAGQCVTNDGTLAPCELVQIGDCYECQCQQDPEPCPTELAQFTFTGTVFELFNQNNRPAPWNQVQIGMPFTLTYWFARFTADQNADPFNGDYPSIVYYQMQVGPVVSNGALIPGSTLIQNNSGLVVAPARYVASFQFNSPPIPGPVSARLSLVDPTSTVWVNEGLMPIDELPLCDDITLAAFAQREFNIAVTLPIQSWRIQCMVTGFSCTDCAPPTPGPDPATARPEAPSDQLGGSKKVSNEEGSSPMPVRRRNP